MTGIYKITNTINDKIYIGQASDFDRRKKTHYTSFNSFCKSPEKHSSGCRILYNAFKKYGFDNFIFELIEECSTNELNEKEQYWLDFYKSYEIENGYNLSRIAGSCLGTKRSDGTKKKMSDNAKMRTGDKNPFYNKHHSESSKDKISKAKTGCQMPPSFLPKWEKYKIWKDNEKKILQYDIWGNFKKEWNSLNEVFYELNIKVGRISECLHKKQLTAGGFIWKNYENNYPLKIETHISNMSLIRNINKYYKLNK
jgi:group I intron endonuclease